MSGKGDKRRPMQISQEELDKRWEAVFKNKPAEDMFDHLMIDKILTKEEFNNLATQKEKDMYLTEFDILHKRAILSMEAIYAYRQDKDAYDKSFVTTGVSDIQ